MSNVPTISSGPNDTERAPEGATETIPLTTDVHATQQNGSTSDTTEISDEEAYADAVLPPASWVPSRSLPLSQPWLSMRSLRALAGL